MHIVVTALGVPRAIVASNNYDGVEVEKGGKVLFGNKYGGKDFWD
jgi:hypothetical protein